MADKCGNCINIEWSNKERYTSVDRYWCLERHKYVSPTDTKCSYGFIENKNNSNDGGYTPSGCYITTIIVDILGYDDNCEVLQILRDFRDNYLRINSEFLPLLIQYDKIGPAISKGIMDEKNHVPFCLGLLKYFLIPCAELIKQKRFTEAVEFYKNMVTYLADEFSIPVEPISMDEDYDIATVGKGRTRISKNFVPTNA